MLSAKIGKKGALLPIAAIPKGKIKLNSIPVLTPHPRTPYNKM